MSKWLKVGLALLLATLSWEVLITLLAERHTGHDVDALFGVVAKPGTVFNGREGFSIERINSHYTRGAEFDVNDASKRRITVLGDSYTEATQVDEDSSFVATTQRKFVENGRTDVLMVNDGHSGKSPPYYIDTGKSWMDFLKSDFVVVQLNEGDFTSDFYSSSQDIYVKRDGDKFTTIRKPQKQGKASGYAKLSAVITRLRVVVEERSQNKSKKTKKPPVDPSFAKEALWFMHEAKAIFPHFAVLYIPTMDYHQRETLSLLPPLEVSLEAAAKAEGVPYINMRSLYARYFLETNQPCHGFNNTIPGTGHINGYGHRLLGEELYKLISPLVSK